MNVASRGVILAAAAVVLGAIILGQGFDDVGGAFAAAPASEEPADPADDVVEPPDDGGAGDDGAATDDGGEGGDGDDGGDDSAAPTDDGGDDSAAPTDDSADIPDVLHEASQVRVLVVNGTTVSGAAGQVNNDLIALGYNGLSPTNTNPPGSAETTSVYFAEGYELDARNLAQTLNAPPASVQPLPDNLPVDDLLEANVVIVLGPDLVTG